VFERTLALVLVSEVAVLSDDTHVSVGLSDVLPLTLLDHIIVLLSQWVLSWSLHTLEVIGHSLVVLIHPRNLSALNRDLSNGSLSADLAFVAFVSLDTGVGFFFLCSFEGVTGMSEGCFVFFEVMVCFEDGYFVSSRLLLL